MSDFRLLVEIRGSVKTIRGSNAGIVIPGLGSFTDFQCGIRRLRFTVDDFANPNLLPQVILYVPTVTTEFRTLLDSAGIAGRTPVTVRIGRGNDAAGYRRAATGHARRPPVMRWDGFLRPRDGVEHFEGHVILKLTDLLHYDPVERLLPDRLEDAPGTRYDNYTWPLLFGGSDVNGVDANDLYPVANVRAAQVSRDAAYNPYGRFRVTGVDHITVSDLVDDQYTAREPGTFDFVAHELSVSGITGDNYFYPTAAITGQPRYTNQYPPEVFVQINGYKTAASASALLSTGSFLRTPVNCLRFLLWTKYGLQPADIPASAFDFGFDPASTNFRVRRHTVEDRPVLPFVAELCQECDVLPQQLDSFRAGQTGDDDDMYFGTVDRLSRTLDGKLALYRQDFLGDGRGSVAFDELSYGRERYFNSWAYDIGQYISVAPPRNDSNAFAVHHESEVSSQITAAGGSFLRQPQYRWFHQSAAADHLISARNTKFNQWPPLTYRCKLDLARLDLWPGDILASWTPFGRYKADVLAVELDDNLDHLLVDFWFWDEVT